MIAATVDVCVIGIRISPGDRLPLFATRVEGIDMPSPVVVGFDSDMDNQAGEDAPKDPALDLMKFVPLDRCHSGVGFVVHDYLFWFVRFRVVSSGLIHTVVLNGYSYERERGKDLHKRLHCLRVSEYIVANELSVPVFREQTRTWKRNQERKAS